MSPITLASEVKYQMNQKLEMENTRRSGHSCTTLFLTYKSATESYSSKFQTSNAGITENTVNKRFNVCIEMHTLNVCIEMHTLNTSQYLVMHTSLNIAYIHKLEPFLN